MTAGELRYCPCGIGRPACDECYHYPHCNLNLCIYVEP